MHAKFPDPGRDPVFIRKAATQGANEEAGVANGIESATELADLGLWWNGGVDYAYKYGRQ